MKLKLLSAVMFWVCAFAAVNAQGPMYGGQLGYFNPDSIDTATLTGTVIIDSSMPHPHYFIDTNSDGTADYFLNFGPYWYRPDSSSAQRPSAGEKVTVKGAVLQESIYGLQSLIVYYINDEYWRDPFDSFWNNMGNNSYMGRFGSGRCSGYAFGWVHDSLSSVTLSGSVLIDTTFMYYHYYLDVNGDGAPDYFLNFGPPWFYPNSGTTRPVEGDNISVTGQALPRAACR